MQRVARAEVSVDGDVVGAIGTGLCVLVAAGPTDDEATARHLADRIALLRIFPDHAGRMNLDIAAHGGAVLVVSQFTLFADTTRGHRPSFVGAGAAEHARTLCEALVEALRGRGLEVQSGRFAAHMVVRLDNDGPVTIVLTSGEPPWDADAG